VTEIEPLDRLRDLVTEMLDEGYKPGAIREAVLDAMTGWRDARLKGWPAEEAGGITAESRKLSDSGMPVGQVSDLSEG
jgi:hypothetical protein